MTDAHGLPIEGVRVARKLNDTGEAADASSEENGNYVFARLRPGRYTLRAEKGGFRAVVRGGLEVAVNETTVIDRRGVRQ